jgi:hypothetical protein
MPTLESSLYFHFEAVRFEQTRDDYDDRYAHHASRVCLHSNVHCLSLCFLWSFLPCRATSTTTTGATMTTAHHHATTMPMRTRVVIAMTDDTHPQATPALARITIETTCHLVMSAVGMTVVHAMSARTPPHTTVHMTVGTTDHHVTMTEAILLTVVVTSTSVEDMIAQRGITSRVVAIETSPGRTRAKTKGTLAVVMTILRLPCVILKRTALIARARTVIATGDTMTPMALDPPALASPSVPTSPCEASPPQHATHMAPLLLPRLLLPRHPAQPSRH